MILKIFNLINSEMLFSTIIQLDKISLKIFMIKINIFIYTYESILSKFFSSVSAEDKHSWHQPHVVMKLKGQFHSLTPHMSSMQSHTWPPGATKLDGEETGFLTLQ